MFTDEELQLIVQVIGDTSVQIKSPTLMKLLGIIAKIKEKIEKPK